MRRHRCRRQPRPHVGGAHEDLRDVEQQRHRRQDHEVLRAVRHRPGPDGDPDHEQQDGRGEHAVDEHQGRDAAERRHQPAVHQGPVPEREPRGLGPDGRPDDQQGERGPGRPQRQPREPRIRARDRRALGRKLHVTEGVRGDVHQDREQRHRGREVQGHEGRRELAPDHDPAEGRLHEHESHRGEARDEDLPHPPVLPPRHHGLEADQDHRDRREQPVGVLDDRVGLERRDPSPEAGRPARAPEPRTRRSNEPPGRDEQDRRSGGGDRELLEARHRPSRGSPER